MPSIDSMRCCNGFGLQQIVPGDTRTYPLLAEGCILWGELSVYSVKASISIFQLTASLQWAALSHSLTRLCWCQGAASSDVKHRACRLLLIMKSSLWWRAAAQTEAPCYDVEHATVNHRGGVEAGRRALWLSDKHKRKTDAFLLKWSLFFRRGWITLCRLTLNSLILSPGPYMGKLRRYTCYIFFLICLIPKAISSSGRQNLSLSEGSLFLS